MLDNIPPGKRLFIAAAVVTAAYGLYVYSKRKAAGDASGGPAGGAGGAAGGQVGNINVGGGTVTPAADLTGIQKVFSDLFGAYTKKADAQSAALGTLIGTGNAANVKAINDQSGVFVKGLSELSKAETGAFKGLSDQQVSYFKSLQTGQVGLTTATGNILGKVGGLGDAITSLGKTGAAQQTANQDFLTKSFKALTDIVTARTDAVGKKVDTIGPMIGTRFDAADKASATRFDALGKIVGSRSDAVMAAVKASGDAQGSLFKTLTDLVTQGFKAEGEHTAGVLTVATKTAADVAAASGVLAKLQAAIDGLGPKFDTTAKPAYIVLGRASAASCVSPTNVSRSCLYDKGIADGLSTDEKESDARSKLISKYPTAWNASSGFDLEKVGRQIAGVA